MPKIPERKGPRLVNRGAAGLLTKVPKGAVPVHPGDGEEKVVKVQSRFQIAPPLEQLAVKIDSLVPDPDNARVHPERNMGAIEESLRTYGQVKPIVVRKSNRVVVAGNGTLEAAKSLGWKKIAAVFVDLTDAEAAGYGLADNRTAELAKWDFEVVARLDKLIHSQGLPLTGWSDDELEVLRAAEWVPPEEDGSDSFGGNGEGGDEPLVIGFNPDQYTTVGKAIEQLRGRDGDKVKQDDALVVICTEWMKWAQLGD